LLSNGYSEVLCRMFSSSSENPKLCNISIDPSNQKPYFKGYLDRDYIHQISVVMTMWNEAKAFPINFYPLEGFTEEDQTSIMNQNTEQL